jgi:hypothetical protein
MNQRITKREQKLIDDSKRGSHAKMEERREKRRLELIAACQLNDSNGVFSDEDCRDEGVPPLTEEGVWEILFSWAFEGDWTSDDWFSLGLNAPARSEVYENVIVRMEADVRHLGAMVCNPDDGATHQARAERGLNLRLLGAAVKSLAWADKKERAWQIAAEANDILCR